MDIGENKEARKADRNGVKASQSGMDIAKHRWGDS